jgi:hypothetical protein
MNIRTVYGIFDFLSEMGGLISIWIPATSLILQLIQIPRLYLVSLMKQTQPVIRKINKKSRVNFNQYNNTLSD